MTTQHLVIVRRGETQVFERLQAEFARGPKGAQVIWDRRVRDRRVIIQDVEAERRRGERRAPLDATMWTTRGYIVARPGPAADAVATTLTRPRRRTRRGEAGEPSA
ncbi:MAG: hypothetical protein HY359_06285 [Candidatus Rokubacteria bacterium]|nr:hypothetical protein [Candidatus Rokubacteria bacterium]